MKFSTLATALAIAASGAQALAISREVDSKLAARSMNDLNAREDSNPVLVARGIHPRFLGEDSAYTKPTGIRQKCSAVASRLSRVAHSCGNPFSRFSRKTNGQSYTYGNTANYQGQPYSDPMGTQQYSAHQQGYSQQGYHQQGYSQPGYHQQGYSQPGYQQGY
ncbi:hypothetical protein MCOR25_007202 [Pyricularia grisea]|nr:hypothetical protein MCOR25_007202 [Pyricularia grisea]